MVPEPLAAEPDLFRRATHWYRDAADLMARVGTPELPQALDDALRRLIEVDLTVCFAYPSESRPIFPHNGLGGRAPGQALQNYLDGAYLLDPFYTACAIRTPQGLHRMREFAPDGFFEGDYVNSWEVHPCISMESGSLSEEIGYMVELSDETRAVFSLMRANGSPPFSASEFELLEYVEPVVSEVIRRHWSKVARPNAGRGVGALGEMMEIAFERFGSGALSRREQLVAQMILRGRSTCSISANLGIAEGTVRNHRKSIYAKLGIASQQQLFSRFMSHVLA